MQVMRNGALNRMGLVALLAALALPGCGGPPPPPPPTVASLTISASPDANGTAGGPGAPTIVRIYQLTSTAGFEKAEFFRLFNGDAALLGQDLVKRDEYLMAPGSSKTETLTVTDKVQALGVLAAYRDVQTKTWRGVVKLPPNKTTEVKVQVTGAGLVTAP